MNEQVRGIWEKRLAALKRRDPQLHDELKQKLEEEVVGRHIEATMGRAGLTAGLPVRAGRAPGTGVERFTESIIRAHERPVMLVRNNQLVGDFAGPESAVWRDRLTEAATRINTAIPSVGRIEVPGFGPSVPFLGTGWLIDEEVLVTNRHVARLFARRDGARFVFKQGPGGPLASRIDFLEEAGIAASLEFPVEEVLWIAPARDVDMAMLKVRREERGRRLARPVRLSRDEVQTDQFVIVIGYPARDPDLPNQQLMDSIFEDVFDKKRVAPGQVISAQELELEHDCSTLGGNSGSVVLDLGTGEAVGLHFAGTFMTANFAVPASVVQARKTALDRGELVEAATVRDTSTNPTDSGSIAGQGQGKTAPPPAAVPSFTAIINVPLEITVRLGGGVDSAAFAGAPDAARKDGDSQQESLQAAKEFFLGDPNVIDIRMGYRFSEGWITKDRVIVVEVKDRLAPRRKETPSRFGAFGVEIRTASVQDRLRSESVLPVEEAAVRRGQYRKPRDLQLREVDEPMNAIFHVSPDSGFPNLRAFLGRTESRITATMYEWDAEHVRDAVLDAVRQAPDTLSMVTQFQSPRSDRMGEFVDFLRGRLHSRFDQVFASVGSGLLFPTAYHIKVAVRDGREFWLSSGNWKNSGQPDIDPAGTNERSFTPLREHNREWHAIIENQKLADQFESYIRFDLAEARRVPRPEAVPAPPSDVFVPLVPVLERPRAQARYFKPLVVNRRLRIQPLLSPDNYHEFVDDVIREAESSILFQNQSFNLLGRDGDFSANDDEFLKLFQILKDKQEAGMDVRIIMRDGREFGRDAAASQKALLERLQDFGFNMDNVRVQNGCHTKGIVVDGSVVVLGSHNWTNQGVLANRDASLIVHDRDVAKYFGEVFQFDWDNLAHQNADELPGAVRLALPGEETPFGMRRVPLAEYLEATEG